MGGVGARPSALGQPRCSSRLCLLVVCDLAMGEHLNCVQGSILYPAVLHFPGSWGPALRLWKVAVGHQTPQYLQSVCRCAWVGSTQCVPEPRGSPEPSRAPQAPDSPSANQVVGKLMDWVNLIKLEKQISLQHTFS